MSLFSIKPSHFFAASLILSACGFSLSSAEAEDWPNWMGKTRDGVWHEKGMIEKFSEDGPAVVWRQKIGGGYAGPAIVGDQVFIMERTKDDRKGIDVENNFAAAGEIAGGERIKCLSLKDGSTVWEHSYESAYKIAYPSGPRCTPTVDGEHVYVLGAMGDLFCLGKSDGKIVWEKDLAEAYDTKPPLWGYSSHPLVDGDRLIVPVGGKGSGVVAFNKRTGEEIWKSVDTFDIAYAPLVIYSNEVDGKPERQMIFWHAEGIHGLDPESGKELWFVKFPEERNMSQTQIATPRIVGNKLFISEFYKGSILLDLGSNPPSAKELWRSRTDDPRSQKSLNAMMATPVVKDGLAYGIGYNGRGEGVMRCVDLETNEMKWDRADWLGEKPIQFSTAFPVENEGRFYLFSDIGELLIGKFSPAGFELLDRAKILEPTTPARGRKVVWCHPAFSAGKMIVRNDEEIVCVDLKKKS